MDGPHQPRHCFPRTPHFQPVGLNIFRSNLWCRSTRRSHKRGRPRVFFALFNRKLGTISPASGTIPSFTKTIFFSRHRALCVSASSSPLRKHQAARGFHGVLACHSVGRGYLREKVPSVKPTTCKLRPSSRWDSTCSQELQRVSSFRTKASSPI